MVHKDYFIKVTEHTDMISDIRLEVLTHIWSTS